MEKIRIPFRQDRYVRMSVSDNSERINGKKNKIDNWGGGIRSYIHVLHNYFF